MSETENDESQLGFEEEIQMIRDYVEENPDDEDAQSLLEFVESLRGLTCTFCLGKYHTVQ
jgi:hypothetical protein